MAESLSAIIAKGDTTAIATSMVARELTDWMTRDRSACHVSEDDPGLVPGFQRINANIRADDFGGIASFKGLGFESYGHTERNQRTNSQIVEKALKRYDP